MSERIKETVLRALLQKTAVFVCISITLKKKRARVKLEETGSKSDGNKVCRDCTQCCKGGSPGWLETLTCWKEVTQNLHSLIRDQWQRGFHVHKPFSLIRAQADPSWARAYKVRLPLKAGATFSDSSWLFLWLYRKLVWEGAFAFKMPKLNRLHDSKRWSILASIFNWHIFKSARRKPVTFYQAFYSNLKENKIAIEIFDRKRSLQQF